MPAEGKMIFKSVRRWAENHPFIFAPGFVGAATLLFLPGRELLGKGHWALLYLLVISVVASVAGSRPSFLAALSAFLAWDVFFLPPYNTFRVDDPKDWISLGVFLVVGLLIGLTSGRLREREALAVAQEREMALLNRLTGRLLAIQKPLDMAETLCAEIEAVFSPRFIPFHLTDSAKNRALLFGMRNDLDEDPLEEDFLRETAERSVGIALPPSSRPAPHRVRKAESSAIPACSPPSRETTYSFPCCLPAGSKAYCTSGNGGAKETTAGTKSSFCRRRPTWQEHSWRGTGSMNRPARLKPSRKGTSSSRPSFPRFPTN
jgi:hypothetical protein